MRILLTGGAGFIGSGIHAACVNNGHKVVVVDNFITSSAKNFHADADIRRIDIRDRANLAELFANEKFDVICHQAAQISVSFSMRLPYFDAGVNCMGLLNILDHAVQHGCKRIVFASSGGTLYGNVTTPAKESAPINPISPYGISKWVGERYLEFYARNHGLEAVALRYSNVYGPRQNSKGEAGVIAIFCDKLAAEQPLTIYGDGEAVRDYIYVDDVVSANLAAMLSNKIPAGELTTLNIGTGIGTTTATVAHMLQQEIHDRFPHLSIKPIEHAPAREGDVRCSLLDPSRAYETLDWMPTVKLAEGLRKTISWFTPSDI